MDDTPPAVVVAQPVAIVVQPRQAPAAVVAAGPQGPSGRDGVDGATLSPDPENQIEDRPNGLYVAPPTWAENNW